MNGRFGISPGAVSCWILAALSALAWQGCGDSDVPAMPGPDDRFIRFYDSDSLSKEVTTHTIADFSLTAYTNSADGQYRQIMDNVTVTRTGLNSWTYSPLVEWPGTPVDFFAVSPASIGIVNNQWWYHIVNFSDPDAATDLLVAVNMGVTQNSGRVRLNFRHALAQVNVSLRTSRPDVVVEVRRVSIKDVAVVGMFHYPAVTTTPSGNDGSLFSCWKSYNMSNTDLKLFHALTATQAIVPTSVPRPVSEEGNFTIPVEFSPLQMDSYIHGSRLELLVRFADRATGHTLWPNADTPQILRGEVPNCGLACFSLQDATPEARWYPGVDYNYSIDIDSYPTVYEGSRSSSPLSSVNCHATPM